MNRLTLITRLMLTIILLLLTAVAAFAAGGSVTPISTKPGVFVLQGNGFDNVAGLELVMTYNSAVFSGPTVQAGSLVSGALFISNANNPGQIRIAIVSTNSIAGSGPVATISFAKHGAGSLVLSFVKLIDQDSKTLVSGTGGQAESVAGSDSGASTGSTPTITPDPVIGGGATVTPSPGSSGAGVLGTMNVTLPSDQREAKATEQSKAEPVPLVEPPVESTPPSSGEVQEGQKSSQQERPETAEAEKKQVAYAAVLDRFRDFKGERTAANLLAFFDQPVAEGLAQEPSVILSDGLTLARVSLRVPGKGLNAPNFAINGASMKGVKRGEGNVWNLELLPEKGRMDVVITVMSETGVYEYPLTVVMPLDPKRLEGLSLDEAGFNRFLKDRGTAKQPKYDLNGDAVRDFLDEYLFAAHCKLAGFKTKGTKGAK